MKLIPIVLAIILINCSETKNTTETARLSKAQFYLHNLRDSLRTEYSQTPSDQSKKSVLEKYQKLLQHYLMHNYIDTIKVVVDKIKKEGWAVTTVLHDGDIEFKHTLIFNKTMPPRVDSVYKFMLELKPGTTKTVNFDFSGDCQVNNPYDKSLPTFIILAFPIPLEFTGR